MFRIFVKVSPAAKQEKLEYIDEENILKIWTKAPAKENKANIKVVEMIADYLAVSKNCVQIVTGLSSKQKIVQIEGELTKETFIKKLKLF